MQYRRVSRRIVCYVPLNICYFEIAQSVVATFDADHVKMDLTVKIMDGDTIQTVRKPFTISDIHDMRQNFLDNVEFGDDYDAVYEITEEGKRYLEELEHDRDH